jgi:uncharacterized protein (TIGR02145 family)/uncharacterized repeat protein (TIGR02543 family)
MLIRNRISIAPFLASAPFLVLTLCLASVCVSLSSCSKKPKQETAPESPDTLSVTYDTLSDARDGKRYRTVKMPDGKTWMAENLNYQTDGSRCYNNSAGLCDKYGRLYDRNTALNVCPSGWHLPAAQEWDSLYRAAGGGIAVNKNSSAYRAGVDKKLKSTSGWSRYDDYVSYDKDGNGTDDYGFSALPGGWLYDASDFQDAGKSGIWWIAPGRDGYSGIWVIANNAERYEWYDGNKDIVSNAGRHSVRCVMDEAGFAYTLTARIYKPDGGSVSRDPVLESYAPGARVTVTAQAANGYTFTGWAGDTAGTANTLTVTMNANKTLTAIFHVIVPFTDPRDGNTYRTVIINGKSWMAQNLNFAADSSRCYRNLEDNCSKYGRLYDWNTARRVCPKGWHLPSSAEWDNLIGYVEKDGLPECAGEYGLVKCGEEDDEYYEDDSAKYPKIDIVAGKKLKAMSGWNDNRGYNGNGTDDYGFSALPGGWFDRYDDCFLNAGGGGSWWTATKGANGGAYARQMYNYDDEAQKDDFNLYDGFSVRCVADTPKTDARPLPKTFTDKRDGKTYRTVKIGKQTWMAENLNVKTDDRLCYGSDDSYGEYGNDNPYCKKYGGLYDWWEAKKACPSGWHLPTLREWDVLIKHVGGKEDIAGQKLKAICGWCWNNTDSVSGNGTDDYGFSALPGGVYYVERIRGMGFNYVGEDGEWWTTATAPDAYEDAVTNSDYPMAWSTIMSCNYPGAGRNYRTKQSRLSVRCVQNAPSIPPDTAKEPSNENQ